MLHHLANSSVVLISHADRCVMVLICMLMTNVENLFTFQFAVDISSLVKCLFTSFARVPLPCAVARRLLEGGKLDNLSDHLILTSL